MPKYTVYAEVTKTVKYIDIDAPTELDARDVVMEYYFDGVEFSNGDVINGEMIITKVKEE